MKPAILALFLYSLMPILRNTYDGFTPWIKACSIRPGDGIQHRPNDFADSASLIASLHHVRCPHYDRVYHQLGNTGFLIGAGGLGQLIVSGLGVNKPEMIFIGGIGAILLALVADGLLGLLEGWLSKHYHQNQTGRCDMNNFNRKQRAGRNKEGVMKLNKLKRIPMLVCLMALAAFTSACGIQSDITIGTQTYTETKIIAEMYKALIEDQTDLKVDVIPDLASSSLVINAMKRNDVQMATLYTGEIFNNHFPISGTKDRDQVLKEAQDGFRNTSGSPG